MEVTDAEEAAEAEASQGPKHLPHRFQLAGAPSTTAAHPAFGRQTSTTRGSSMTRQASKRHRRTADDRRQASLRITSVSKGDPVLAAAAAAALDQEMHSHGHGHHPHHHHHHHQAHGHGTEHATITISADGTAVAQQQHSVAASADGTARSGSPFASSVGQAKAAAAVLGDVGLAVAGASKPEAKEEPSTAILPAGWPASGGCFERQAFHNMGVALPGSEIYSYRSY